MQKNILVSLWKQILSLAVSGFFILCVTLFLYNKSTIKNAQLSENSFELENIILTNTLQLSFFILLIFFTLFCIFLYMVSKWSKSMESETPLSLKNKNLVLNEHSLVSITDLSGTIVSVNDKFSQVSGYTEAELIGKKHSLLNSNAHPKAYWKNMYDTVLAGKAWKDEVRNINKAGEFYWVDTTIMANFDENKKVNGFISVRTEITQNKKNIEALALAKEKAEVANASKDEFLANMSHEIRTPMNGVIGMTNLLLDTELDKDQTKLANTVKASANGLLSIINDILDFSKAEAGKLTLELIPFNFEKMIGEVGITLSFQAHEKDLVFVCPANYLDHQWYKADSGRIKQVLTNLIGNAIKFTSEGQVAVYIKTIEENDTTRTLRFEVQDTGIGIEASQQKKLFDKFSQADNSTTRKYGGTGLGLSISKQLVELMGGEIGIESQLGIGSTFWFTLPLLKAEKTDEAVIYRNEVKNEKILIVDDNEVNRELMHQLHDNWEIPHKTVKSALEAMQELEDALQNKVPYSIAILDMQMPEIDGIELINKIKGSPQLAQTNLIMASSQLSKIEETKLHELGVKDILCKPIQQSELLNILLNISGLLIETSELENNVLVKKSLQLNAHILVAEDNLTNQLVIKGMLKKLGLTVDVVEHGQEAIEALQSSNAYDLIFMDCQMPILDGYQTTKKIRSGTVEKINCDIPIVAMTANAMAGDKEKCLDSGMNDYLPKPVELESLINILEKWLSDKNKIKKKIVNLEEQPTPIEYIDEGDIAIFNYEAMAKRLMNDPDLIKSIIEIFLEDCAQQIHEFQASIQDDNFDQATVLAHKIKGAAANVGGERLSELAKTLEFAGKSENRDSLRNNAEQLDVEFNILKTVMQNKV